MKRQELLKKLKECKEMGDFEHQHALADKFLLEFINDEEISKAFDEIGKWYA